MNANDMQPTQRKCGRSFSMNGVDSEDYLTMTSLSNKLKEMTKLKTDHNLNTDIKKKF